MFAICRLNFLNAATKFPTIANQIPSRTLTSPSVNSLSLLRKSLSSTLLSTNFSHFSKCSIPPASSSTSSILRSLSTSTTNTTTQDKKAEQEAPILPKDEPNIFLDNLGKIFALIILSIITVLVRSSKGNTNKKTILDAIEDASPLDPVEIEDMRLANSDFKLDMFNMVVKDVYDVFGGRQGGVSYKEFIPVVIKSMVRQQGMEGFTVQLGHYIDRVILGLLMKEGYRQGLDGVEEMEDNIDSKIEQEGDIEPQVYSDDTPLPLNLLLVTLSLALYTTVDERIIALYTMLQLSEGKTGQDQVTEKSVAQLIHYLRDTCQLSPENQIVETDTKYPIQQYKIGTGEELMGRSRMIRDGLSFSEGLNEITGAVGTDVDEEQFTAILKSRAVGAWGECWESLRRF